MKSKYCTFFILTIFHFSIVAQTKISKSEIDTIKNDISKQYDTLINEEWRQFILGDINNDNIIDTAFVNTPAYYATIYPEYKDELPMFKSCINDSCYNKVKFSSKFSEIYRPNTLWGSVEPIQDLDEDGIKEIVFQTNWYIGTHVEIYLYSFNKIKGEWVILAKNWLYGEDSYKDRIKKINKEKFKFKIEYMDPIEHDIKNKNIIVKIKK